MEASETEATYMGELKGEAICGDIFEKLRGVLVRFHRHIGKVL